MSDMNFAKGMTVKTIKKDDWEIIKLGIHHEKFYENPINENGYINIILKRSKKTGEWFAVQDDWKPTQKADNSEIVEFTETEIPF